MIHRERCIFAGKDFNLTRTFSPSAYPGLDVHTGNFHIWNGGLLFQTFNEGRTEVYLSGDSYPATPIGINLPNSNWIRAQYGSKSVTIENTLDA